MKSQMNFLKNLPIHEGNILVINERHNNSCLLSDILTPKGYTVQQFSTTQAALEAISKQIPDLIVTGIHMPDMSGFDLCKKLKSDENTNEIPIIFISPFIEIGEKEKAFAVGGSDCITIPFHSEELLTRVNNCLAFRQMHQQCEKFITDQTAKLLKSKQRYKLKIEELKKTEKALIYSEKLHKEAQEIAKIGHWELNLLTNELKWSDEQFKIFEIDNAKFGASYEAFLNIVHPDDRDYVDRAYPDSVKNKTEYDIIHRILCKNKQVKYLHERCRTEYDKNGIPLRSIGTTQDVTALKEAELEKKAIEGRLSQAQKLEAIGTLAGGIAHDFNNLLNVILGYSDMLLIDTPKTSQQYSDVEQINKAGQRATELVSQILTFSRRTEQEQERQPIQLKPLVKEAMKLLRSSLPTTIAIRQDIRDCASVIADNIQIHQVIMNLCTNAFHAMQNEKGVLEVRLEEIDVCHDLAIQIENLSESRHVCLTVSDTGQGIDKITMDRIFEPYFTTKSKGEGTGLGLATVHGIVTSHGGAISVESEVGQGTTFSIYFPIAEIDINQARVDEYQKEFPTLKGRILLIDDVEFNVQLGTHVCERLGCTTKGLTNSLEALALFRKTPEEYDIVITDQTMPNLTGFELAIELLKIRSDIPIVLVTGHSDIVDKKKAEEIGIRDFLTKPLDINTLADALSTALS